MLKRRWLMTYQLILTRKHTQCTDRFMSTGKELDHLGFKT